MRDFKKLSEMIKYYEGFKAKPYRDTEGLLTIGYGRCIERTGISIVEAGLLLDNSLNENKSQMDKYDWFNRMNDVRQDVVLMMVYQMGFDGFMAFKKLVIALYVNDYDKASVEMLDSKWHKQTPRRAEELAAMMKSGQYLR